MDVAKFVEGLGIAKSAVELLKGVKELLPSSPQKDAADASLKLAEKAFRIAETQAAQELGYNLCDCSWPPQIALRQLDGSRSCPNCHRNTNEDFGTIEGPGGY